MYSTFVSILSLSFKIKILRLNAFNCKYECKPLITMTIKLEVVRYRSWNFGCYIIKLHFRSKNLTKKRYVLSYSFFCYCKSIDDSSENMPDSRSSAYRRTYYHLFKPNILSAHIRKIQITLSYSINFFLNIWNDGKNIQDLQPRSGAFLF